MRLDGDLCVCYLARCLKREGGQCFWVPCYVAFVAVASLASPVASIVLAILKPCDNPNALEAQMERLLFHIFRKPQFQRKVYLRENLFKKSSNQSAKIHRSVFQVFSVKFGVKN